MKCTGAIFDMVGVLFDTERIYQQTWHEMAAERQITLGDGFLREISGSNGERMYRTLEAYFQVSDGTVVARECMERIRKKLSVHVPIKEGVQEILQFFKDKGLRIAVASSSSFEQIESNLKIAGIHSYFDEIVSGAEVKHGKPAPDIFLYAAERIGCKPEECFVFEDSENGVRAGHAAGCITIMVPDLIEASDEILPYCSKVCLGLLKAREEIKDIL